MPRIEIHRKYRRSFYGLKNIQSKADSMWGGWPGISEEEITPEGKTAIM